MRSPKILFGWKLHVAKTFQWALPLSIVTIDLLYKCNDVVGLIAWALFIFSAILWITHFTDVGMSTVFCVLESMLATTALFCYSIALCMSFWDFYSSVKYGTGNATHSLLYGALCFLSLLLNFYLFWAYLGTIFLQYVLASEHGLRRKERREERFAPMKVVE